MARCHRIGQTKSVRVYRLVMRGTYEEQLLKAAARKFGLEEALLGSGTSGEGGDPTADAARLDELLKHGASALALCWRPKGKMSLYVCVSCALSDTAADASPLCLSLGAGVMAFKDDSAAAETARFCAEDIEDILLKRAERRQVGSRKGNTFSTATFVAEDEPPPGAAAGAGGAAAVGDAGEAVPGAGMTGAEFWAAALPDAAAMAAAGPHIDHRFAVEGPRQRKKARSLHALMQICPACPVRPSRLC
jgi:hypothetical protein